jgi:hypothetical protein
MRQPEAQVNTGPQPSQFPVGQSFTGMLELEKLLKPPRLGF